MKKLYRKSTVHPTPSVVSDHLLSLLPAAILALTAALSPEDREVLAYIISCSSSTFSDTSRRSSKGGCSKGGGGGCGDDHPPCFNCSCFRCYKSYWVRWDESSNRQLIDEILDAFEDSLLKESKKEKNRKDRRKGKSGKANSTLVLDESFNKSDLSSVMEDSNFGESTAASESAAETAAGGGSSGGDEDDSVVEEEEVEKGSMRRFVSFLGERIWGVWG
ncbi:uncharacterized protein LOC127247992 [Andrographis paniculata]|uniref:uncharacterized protein LOC127247992 n=1 Tax=Andrographis paniculata TaxID=175694 RepID=UPI0021E90659|nr:uncharacterized protein LOC127247992 [Andrographis paniculata]